MTPSPHLEKYKTSLMYNRYVKIFFCSLYTTTRLAMPKCLFDLPLWEYIHIWEHSGCTWRKCTNALEGVGMHIPFAFQYTIYSVKCTHAHEGGSRDAQCALHMLSAFQALFVRSGESETRTDFAELLLCHTKTDLCLALHCTNQILKNYALLCTPIFLVTWLYKVRCLPSDYEWRPP